MASPASSTPRATLPIDRRLERRSGGGSIADSLTVGSRRVVAGIALIALLLGGMNLYVLVAIRPPSLRYISGERAVGLAHSAMIDQETGLRGYLLTKDSSYLDSDQQGVKSLATQNDLASRYLGADPRVAGLLQNMRTAQQMWLDQWASVALIGPPSDPPAFSAFLRQGKNLFDAYRVTEQALVDRVEAERAALSRREGDVLMLMPVVLVVMGSALVIVTVVERRRFRRVLLGPVAEILQTTDRIANRELDSRANVNGPDEFRRIAAAVNQMASALRGYQDHLAEENEQVLAEMQGRVALEERTFLARELHDSISQILFSMTLQARAAELTLEKEGLGNPGALAGHLSRMRELTNGALAEMRALIFELRPGALREEGLVAALRKQAAGIAARDGFIIEVEAPEERILLDPITEEQLYRIGQEALHNIMKHAGASRVGIRLEAPTIADGGSPEPGAAAGDLVLEISDDGAGFDPTVARPGHLGLQTMSQRARRIGGRMEIISRPGAGTRIRVSAPPGRGRPPESTPDRPDAVAPGVAAPVSGTGLIAGTAAGPTYRAGIVAS